MLNKTMQITDALKDTCIGAKPTIVASIAQPKIPRAFIKHDTAIIIFSSCSRRNIMAANNTDG